MQIAAGDEAARACMYASRSSRQHWTLVYLLQNPGWTGTAVIIDAIGKKARIFIPSLAYETDMNMDTEPELNQSVRIKVRRIRLAYLQVMFEPL